MKPALFTGKNIRILYENVEVYCQKGVIRQFCGSYNTLFTVILGVTPDLFPVIVMTYCDAAFSVFGLCYPDR